jgi:hypothetical protein
LNLLRRKIRIAQKHIYSISKKLSSHVWWWKQKYKALCARIRTSHTSPMLWIDCPFPTSPFGPNTYPTHPPQLNFHTYDTFNRQKTTLTRLNLLMSRTLSAIILLKYYGLSSEDCLFNTKSYCNKGTLTENLRSTKTV